MGRIEPGTYVHPDYWGWNNAPPFRRYAAAQREAGGLWFWGARYDGEIAVTIEDQGTWSNWSDAGWPGYAGRKAMKLGAAGPRDGLQLWAIDDAMSLWSVANHPLWDRWIGPNWNNAPPVHEVAAVRLNGNTRTGVVWAITATDFSLICSYKEGGAWTPWTPWNLPPKPTRFQAITAAQQGNGRAQMWALDTSSRIWSCEERTPGGPWDNWSAPDWNGVPPPILASDGGIVFSHIAACAQGGNRGAVVWAIHDFMFLTAAAQQTPGGKWDAWPKSAALSTKGWGTPGTSGYVGPIGDPHIVRVAAAQQSNGTLRLWATLPHHPFAGGSLWSIQQTSPGGEWGHWDGNYRLPPWVKRD